MKSSHPVRKAIRVCRDSSLRKFYRRTGGALPGKEYGNHTHGYRRTSKSRLYYRTRACPDRFRTSLQTHRLTRPLATSRNVPPIICDTGHNTGGISYIADQLRGIQADKLHIVIGMVNDKDIHSVLRQLPQCATYYFTKANVKRALTNTLFKHLLKKPD